jgi:hypothetical protein
MINVTTEIMDGQWNWMSLTAALAHKEAKADQFGKMLSMLIRVKKQHVKKNGKLIQILKYNKKFSKN